MKHSKPRGMTPKQQIFVREYLVDLNATQAAVRAGYKKSYATHAHEFLRKPAIAAAVQEDMDARARRTEIDADRVLREYAKLAFVDIRRLVKKVKTGETERIELRDLWDMSDADAAAIVHLWRTDSGNGLRIKLHDKNAALDAIARHLGLWRPRALPFAGDYSNEQQRRARDALKARLEAMLNGEEEGGEEETAGEEEGKEE